MLKDLKLLPGQFLMLSQSSQNRNIILRAVFLSRGIKEPLMPDIKQDSGQVHPW